MFFGLGFKERLSVFTEYIPIREGAIFYRIRRTKGINDPSNPKEWEPVPRAISKQGRFNSKGESVLYVSSDSFGLGREVGLIEGERYYLAKYVCKKSFIVGSFLAVNNPVNTLIHKIAMSVSEEGDLRDKEKVLIQKYYEKISYDIVYEYSCDQLAPLYMYKEINNLYDVTNRLGKLLLYKYPYGIRYASVYFPVEISGGEQIITLDGENHGNYVFSREGFENLKLVSVEEKTFVEEPGLELYIKEMARGLYDIEL